MNVSDEIEQILCRACEEHDCEYGHCSLKLMVIENILCLSTVHLDDNECEGWEVPLECARCSNTREIMQTEFIHGESHVEVRRCPYCDVRPALYKDFEPDSGVIPRKNNK